MAIEVSALVGIRTPPHGVDAVVDLRDLEKDRAETLCLLLDQGPTMVFQPIVSLPSGVPVGVEALARFGSHRTELPGAWFAKAARTGVAVELECAAIAAALPVLDRLLPQQFLALNAAPATALSDELASLLAGVDPSRIVLELTEHAPVSDYACLDDALRPFRDAGMRVAVDDLGAGHATLTHALALQPDVVKLDRTLIAGLELDARRRSLVAALVAWADDAGMVAIAEGVERPGELAALLDIGVRQAQGFIFGKPSRRLVQGCRTTLRAVR